MDRGILFAIPGALAYCALAHACRTPVDPGPLHTVDSLITFTEAALLTLNELDTVHYAEAEAFHARHAGTVDSLLHDTLDSAHAELLVNTALVVRQASRMANDHRRVAGDLVATSERLRALRSDIEKRAIAAAEAQQAVAHEHSIAVDLDTAMHRLLDNYRNLQGIAAAFPHTDSLLTPPIARP